MNEPTHIDMSNVDKSDITALRQLANLMDEDDVRTNKVGIPVSYGHHLIWLAVIGTYEAWEAEWVQLAKTKSVQVADEWSAQLDTRVRRLTEWVYPGGILARSKSAQDIRDMADQAENAA